MSYSTLINMTIAFDKKASDNEIIWPFIDQKSVKHWARKSRVYFADVTRFAVFSPHLVQ